jgi:hypothetical protein
LRAPSALPVAEIPNSVLAGTPKRVSVPSNWPPTAAVTVPVCALCARFAPPSSRPKRIPTTTSIVRPSLRFPAIRPNVRMKAVGTSSMSRISRVLLHADGFSNGCALLALKKPPPSPDISLIGSQEPTGPPIRVWPPPATVCNSWAPPMMRIETAAGRRDRVGGYHRPGGCVPAHRYDHGAGVVRPGRGALDRDSLVGAEERLGRAGLVEAHHADDRAGRTAAGVVGAEHRADAVGGAVRPGAVDSLQPPDLDAAGADQGEQTLLPLVRRTVLVRGARHRQYVDGALRAEVARRGGGRVVAVTRHRGPRLEVLLERVPA